MLNSGSVLPIFLKDGKLNKLVVSSLYVIYEVTIRDNQTVSGNMEVRQCKADGKKVLSLTRQ